MKNADIKNADIEQLYNRLYLKLLHYAKKMISCSAAEDIVQEAYCLALEKNIINYHENIDAWLYTFVRNNIYNLYRRQNREISIYYEEQEKHPERFALHYEFIEIMEFLRQELNQEEYFIIQQIYINGFTEKELSMQLHISHGAMRSRVLRIKRKITQKLSDNYTFILILLLKGLD